jgi:hypothetical protein
MDARCQERVPDLVVELLPNGNFSLEQADGVGESVTIHLHPIHIRHLAERAGLLSQSASPVPTARLRARLDRIKKQAIDLFELLDGIPQYPPSAEQTADVLAASDLIDAIEDLLVDYFPDPVAETTKSPAVPAAATESGQLALLGASS